MAETNFFGHRDKRGSEPLTRVKRQGCSCRVVAKNVAAGQSGASEVVQGWMNSPGHRHNIKNCKLTETGVVMIYQANDRPLNGESRPYHYYWVQVFAAP